MVARLWRAAEGAKQMGEEFRENSDDIEADFCDSMVSALSEAAARIAPLAEACGVSAIDGECSLHGQCVEECPPNCSGRPSGERVDALIGRVVSAAMAERRKR